MRQPVTIRPLRAEDYPALGRIFFCAVHEGTRSAYDQNQRLAWGGETIDLDRWKARVRDLTGFVAEDLGEPVGFMTIDQSGYIDLAFVLPSASGKGVGGRLLQSVELWAKDHGVAQLTVAASLIAHPFFLKNGWQVEEQEQVTRKGQILSRYRMRKDLIRSS